MGGVVANVAQVRSTLLFSGVSVDTAKRAIASALCFNLQKREWMGRSRRAVHASGAATSRMTIRATGQTRQTMRKYSVKSIRLAC